MTLPPDLPVENNDDLANLYPAEVAYWRDIEIISVWEAILLSLGIEPRTIRDLACQRDMDDETDCLSYGLQQKEYVRRMPVLQNAIAANVIATTSSGDSEFSGYFKLQDFIGWAIGKDWTVPEWMTALTQPNVRAAIQPDAFSIREQKKAETSRRHQQWITRAGEHKAEHPSWPKTQVANAVAREFNINSKTVYNIITKS